MAARTGALLRSLLLSVLFCAAVEPAAGAPGPNPPNMFFASARGQQNNVSNDWRPMTGLSFTLPASTPYYNFALVTLNAPDTYAVGTNYPGGRFAIFVDNALQLPYATFSSASQRPVGIARVPTTLVVSVKLMNHPQKIEVR